MNVNYSLTGTDSAIVECEGFGTVIAVIGNNTTWSGNIVFYATNDITETVWVSLSGTNLQALNGEIPVNVNSAEIGTADVAFAFNAAGWNKIKFVADGITGTVPIQVSASIGCTIIESIHDIITANTRLQDGGGTPLTSTLIGSNQSLDVHVANTTGAGAVNIQDGGNSITVDGTVALSAGSAVIGHVITDTGSTTAVTGNVTVVQPTGTNLHTVIDSGTTTVTQATGSNLHTVIDSGTVTTVSTVTNLSQLGGAAISMNTGVRDAGTQRVTIATNDSLAVTLAAGATSIGKAEDVASVTADVGVPAMAIRKATPANLSDTDGDYEMLQMSAGRLWTSATIDSAIPAGNNNIGDVDIASIAAGNNNIGDVDVASIAAGTNRIGSVRLVDSADADLTSAKGTQTSRAVGVQELINAGRNQTNFFMAIQIVTTNTDALLSLTGYKSGAAVGATTTPAVVTAAKTYRITSITMSYTTIVTTPGSVRFTLRANTGGTVVITSPAVCNWEVGEPTGIAPVAGKKNTVHLAFPDGIEFAAGTGIGISQVGLNTVGVAAAVGYGQISINGFEY